MACFVRFIAALLAAACPALAHPPANPGFEQGEIGKPPEGWLPPAMGLTAALSTTKPAEGKSCVEISVAAAGDEDQSASLMQQIEATEYRGKRVRVTAMLRAVSPGPIGGAVVWIRGDRGDGGALFVQSNTQDPVRSEQWTRVSFIAEVPGDVLTLNLGIMALQCRAATRIYADDISLTILGGVNEGNRTAAELFPRGKTNLVALAKLWGYARWFNPADEADKVDWDALLLASIERVEPAADDAALAAALRDVFTPIMPGLRIEVADERPNQPEPAAGPAPGKVIRGWRHLGVQLMQARAGMPNVYASRKVDQPIDTGVDELQILPADSWAVRTIAPRVHAVWPVTVYVDEAGTLPRGPANAPALIADRPEGWKPGPFDRTSRLADVIVAWNVFQHFYPYFEISRLDWEQGLPLYLAKAAADREDDQFRMTMESLVGALRDGHGRLLPAHFSGYRPPFHLVWAGDQLVIADPGNVPGLKAGDVILEANERPIEQRLAAMRARISAASEGWFRWRVAESLPGELGRAEQITVKVRHLDGTEAEVTCGRVPMGGGMSRARPPNEPRPKTGDELAPGIIYIDSDGLSVAGLKKVEDKLASARGIVVDARGYPADAGTLILRHLTDKQLTSAQWWIPVSLLPDRYRQNWQRLPSWQLPPLAPRWTRHVAYVIDGRAISYAESCMGIVEHFHLAEIVGEPTAGTNGNVNPLTLPTGSQIMWTGMRVLKHDGSTHHGVGIKPTVPVSRTPKGIAEGRDELVEKAVEVLKARIAAEPPASP